MRGRPARIPCALCGAILYAPVVLHVDERAPVYDVRVRVLVDLDGVDAHLADVHGVALDPPAPDRPEIPQ